MPKEFFQSENDEHFYFHVKGDNGEIVSQSEGYTTDHDAKRGYDALLRAVAPDVLEPIRTHFNTMQDMMRRYLTPNEPYIDRERKVSNAVISHRQDLLTTDELFINDIIHMLDGPEQRAILPNPMRDEGDMLGES